MSDGKCRKEKNYQKNKILDKNVYMFELIVFDDWVTKISLKPVDNSPTRFKQFSVQHKQKIMKVHKIHTLREINK